MRLRLLLFFNSALLLATAVNCEEEIKERVLNRREYDASPSIEQQTIQEFSQNATMSEASFDDVIDEIIDSSHQGRSIEGLDEVYSDPTVKEALLNGDDSQARNLIRDKLCSLGLMECEKRAPVRYIYTQPPPGPVYAQRPGASRPPQFSQQPQHYGQPRPVPLPGSFPPQQPPRKVGYAPSNLNNFHSSKPIGEKYGMEFYESESAPSSIKFGYTEKPTIIVNQGKREVGLAGAGVSQNHHVHHHYVHVDGAAPIDATKILASTPISEYSAVNNLAGSYQTSGFGQSGAAGGFSPSASDFEYKGVNSQGSQGIFNGASGSQGGYNGASGQGIYGGASSNVKPVFESSQFSTGANYNQQQNQLNTGPPQFNEAANGIYNNVGSSYHAGAPDFYKKELNVNGNRGNGLSTSQFYNQQQQQQFNTQKYSKNQYNLGEKYQGFESARQDQFDCVCVPFEQCPAQDVVGRRDDLILPLDPRSLSSEIEADDNSTVSRVVKEVDSKNATEAHKIAKRQVNDLDKVQGEGRLFGFGHGPPGYPPPGYPGGGFGKKIVPTLGVSFGLPFPSHTGYPISPYGHTVNNPHFGALTPNGLNLGLLNVNPLFSFQVTKSEHGEKLLKPFVNLHLSPSENIIGKIGSLLAHKKGPQVNHYHKHLHRYPHGPPPFLPFDPHHHHHHFDGPGLPFPPPPFDGPIYPHPPPHHFGGPILHHPPHHHLLHKPSLLKKFKHQKELLFEDIALNTDLLGLRSSGEVDSDEDQSGGYLANLNEVDNGPQSLQHFPPFDQNGNSLQHFPPFDQNNPQSLQHFPPFDQNANSLQSFPPINQNGQSLQSFPPIGHVDNSLQEYAANAQRVNSGFSVKPQNPFKFDDLQSNPNDIRYARQFNNYDESSNQNVLQSIPAQAPGSAEGSDMVSFPTSRRRRDTDQVVPASIEKKESLESVDSTAEENEGRDLSAEKRQAFYQQSLQQPKQCGPRAVCCRKPYRAPHQQQPFLQQPFQVQQQNKFNKCGVRNAQGINGRIKNPTYIDGDSEFGEYPWQAAILKKDPKESVYVCGGTLIDNSHIITAAHCVKTYSGFDLRVRLGEWDVNHDVEFFPYVERDVISVHVHPEYYAGTLDNDLAILKLSQPVDFSGTPHISPACLPDKFTDFTRQRCWTTGWGKDNWEYGKYQNILKEVDVPIIDQNTCQQQLRQTRLGYNYQLNPGFLCAGGEEGKDACKGDGGGPLVCERNGAWHVAGIVSWGIGCGKANVPGVYVRVAHYLDWIGQITQRY